MAEKEQKISFLVTSITDTQEIIRFIENKTAIVVTIIGAFLVGLYGILENIISYYNKFPFYFWLLFSMFIFFLVTSIFLTARVIFPAQDPIENIKFNEIEKPDLPFFISPNEYENERLLLLRNSKNHKLKLSYNEFKEVISSSNSNSIIESLSVELLKLSFIRNIKNDRFKYLLWSILGTTIFFFFFYVFYLHEYSILLKCQCH